MKAGGSKNRRKSTGSRLQMLFVILFQLLGMALLVLKRIPVPTGLWLTAVCLPVVTYVLNRLPKKLRLDKTLLNMVLFLCSVSIILLFGVTRNNAALNYMQAIFALIGIVAMFVVFGFMKHFSKWGKLSVVLFIVSVVALMAPRFFGSVNGAYNWIKLRIGGRVLTVQPSEFVKQALIIILAHCFSREKWGFRILGIAAAVIFCGILAIQGDFGALLLYFVVTIAMYYASTGNLLVTGAGLGCGLAAAVGAYFLSDNVRNRVMIWLDPWSHYNGKGYQLVQSLIAIASGGLFGMGLGSGSPRVVPLYDTDFVFSSICEQLGLVFALAVMAVYFVIVMRGMSISVNSRTPFYCLAALGESVLIGAQAMLIIGGNVQLLPLTGVTLPFVASGGSSLVASFCGLGILQAVASINRRQDVEDRKRQKERKGGAI